MFHQREITTDQTTVYYPAFDYLRAAAAFGVFVGHADRSQIIPENFANSCVQIFFALSGFLIGGILLRSKIRDIPRFYFNRASRIWIPYAIAIGLLALVTFIKQGFGDPKFPEFFFYMVTFVYNWFGPPQLATTIHHMPLDGTGNHFWSICVEEQFYLVAPLLILHLNRWIAAALLSGVVALNFVEPHLFAAICLGVLLAMSGRVFGIVSALATIALFRFSYEVWMPFVAVSLVAALAIEGAPTRIGRVAGGASYSFYLNSWIGLFLLSALMKFGLNYWLSASVGTIVAIGGSLVHYYAIDLRIQRERRVLFSNSLGVTIAIIGFCLVMIGVFGGLFYYGALLKAP
jgi:peptidoglycan/LPS O-acetylase OafA/YrhL